MKHCKRGWEAEDLEHLDDAIDEGRAGGAIALPGLESIRDQIAIRLGVPTLYDNHDNRVIAPHTLA